MKTLTKINWTIAKELLSPEYLIFLQRLSDGDAVKQLQLDVTLYIYETNI